MSKAECVAVRGGHSGLESWSRQRLAGEALLKEAQSKKWADRPEVKSAIDAAVSEMIERMVTSSYLDSVTSVPVAYPSDAELAAAYEKAKSNFNLPATYRVAHIFLFTPTRADVATIANIRNEAKKLAALARQGDFAVLAMNRSQDARTAERGGALGALPLAQLLPEMRGPVSKLKVGQVSDPVQSEAGFHVIKLLEMKPASTVTLEETKPQLRIVLRERRKQELVRDYVAKLVLAGNIQIDGAALESATRKVN